MSDLWVNIRFGCKHLQIGPRSFRVSTNKYFVENGYDKFFEVFKLKPII